MKQRFQVPVSELEFHAHGNTLWIHGPNGATVLRIKTRGRIVLSTCGAEATSSHCDIVVEDDIKICLLAEDAHGPRTQRKKKP